VLVDVIPVSQTGQVPGDHVLTGQYKIEVPEYLSPREAIDVAIAACKELLDIQDDGPYIVAAVEPGLL